jgi:hypothetical protein
MLADVYDYKDNRKGCLYVEPECGEAFCDSCGDCLVCGFGHWEDCPSGGWLVIYEWRDGVDEKYAASVAVMEEEAKAKGEEA